MVRSRRKVWIGVALLTATTLTGSSGAASAGVEESMGRWLGPFSEGGLFDDRPPITREEAKRLPTAVSIAVSPDGTIMYWNGVENYEDAQVTTGWRTPEPGSSTRILDMRAYLRGDAPSPEWTVPQQEQGIGGDLFCSDLRNLPDGRLLAVGGTRYANEDESLGLPDDRGRTEAWGLRDARTYDPRTRTWSMQSPMNHARWYPSLVTLPDGKMFVAGGAEKVAWNSKLKLIHQTETYDPGTGTWNDNGPSGEAALPFYARLHPLPNGKIFYAASGQMWGPGPYTPMTDSPEWSVQRMYDAATNSWTSLGLAPLGARNGAFSAMLPLKPPYDSARIVVGGGTLSPTTAGTWDANAVTEIIDVHGDSVERRLGPSLNLDRWMSSPVVLPSGELLALGGGDRDDTFFPGTTGAVREPEIYDGERWTRLAPGKRDRVYHSTAVLLGDGSVLVGGHAPVWFTPFGLTHDNSASTVFSSNFRDPSFEIYQPPYLFRGKRPTLAQVQAGVDNGETFRVTTPDAARIKSIVLSRLPAVTHTADTDNRTVELAFEETGPATLEAKTPADPAVLLPGHYYMFLMADNGKGLTPSRAAIVKIGEELSYAAPMPFGI